MSFHRVITGGAGGGEQPPGDQLSPDERELHEKLAKLRQEHRDLDAAILAMADSQPDPFTLARLKKRKLMLKDQIAKVEDALTPDIIA